MSEYLTVRCPVCRRAHRYTLPSYPCACGAPVAPPLDRHRPAVPVAHRAWQEEWVTVRCAACGLPGEWPRPELGCPCGTSLRIPVAEDRTAAAPDGQVRDAVAAAERYLRRLGYRDLRRTGHRLPSGVWLRGHGVLAQVDPAALPATERDVECLWLAALAESRRGVHFSRAGHADGARARGDALGVPLFLIDRDGVPRPVNPPADGLDATGA
ncbi:hypothetical protein [Streptomyces sp. NPDC057115]|jgi:hypothetical protein|uniref:hypothetical protein n=1 Tax=unclassified Streptomyces TaxID=2593676 RepID=UPI001960909A|nr:hypothetical protein [Streptomyces sp. S12]